MSRKSYWSAINNGFENLNRSDEIGVKARKAFFVESNNKKFTEKNFDKNLITKTDLIGAYSKIKKTRDKMLKTAWIRSTKGNRKLRRNTRAFHKFKKANRTKILDEMGGSEFEVYFESPDSIK